MRPGVNARDMARAIRAKCLDCSGGMRAEVKRCALNDCPLWPYRMTGAAAEGDSDGGRSEGITGQINIAELYGEAVG